MRIAPPRQLPLAVIVRVLILWAVIALAIALSVLVHRRRKSDDGPCYMRAIVADDWPAMERGSRLEDPRTLAFGNRLRDGIRGLPLEDERERSAYGRASTLISDAGASRQQLLFFTEPEVPIVLWVLIYVGAFLLVFLLGTHYADRPRGRFTALGSAAALLTVVVVVLTMLDNPFTAGARVQPNSMRDAIDLVSVDREGTPALRPCPENPPPIATEGG
jgi:hypothetical protein